MYILPLSSFPTYIKHVLAVGYLYNQTASYKVTKLGQKTWMRRELLRESGFGLDAVTDNVGGNSQGTHFVILY